MSLTVEDGTGLANADSLVSLADVRAYALSRGVTLDADDTVVEGQIRKAHDYLFYLEDRFKGQRSVEGQALPFPRKCMIVNGEEFDEETVPEGAELAMKLLVCQSLDFDPLPVRDTRVITQETVGPIQTSYRLLGSLPSFPVVDAHLKPYIKNNGQMNAIRV